MALLPLLVDVGTNLEEASGFLQYLLVFLFAAIPVIEILFVVPVAIGIGLNPVLTGVFAFAGNVGSVYVLILFHQRISNWWASRRDAPPEERSDRHARARRVWERYGLPGLSLGGVVLTGVHIATLVALVAGSRARDVAGWMAVSIALWTVVLVVASVFGLSLLGFV